MSWAHSRTRAALAEALIRRDGLACALCGLPIDPAAPRSSRYGLSIDHIVPRSRGGGDELSNLRLAHHGCNASRGNTTTPRPHPRPTRIAAWAPRPTVRPSSPRRGLVL